MIFLFTQSKLRVSVVYELCCLVRPIIKIIEYGEFVSS